MKDEIHPAKYLELASGQEINFTMSFIDDLPGVAHEVLRHENSAIAVLNITSIQAYRQQISKGRDIASEEEFLEPGSFKASLYKN